MTIHLWASRVLLASCAIVVACSSNNDNSTPPGANTPTGSSGGGSGSGGFGGSSGAGVSSSGGSGGDEPTAGDDAGTSGASSSDGAAGTSSGGAAGAGDCVGYIRGGAPTSMSASAAGPYQTKTYAANASVRSTTAYDVTNAHIIYPVGATAPFAAIAIVPGFVSPEAAIADWGPFLASWGIVTMTIGTSNPTTGASDMTVLPPVRGDALLDALTTIKGENTRSGSPLAGQLDLSRLAVAGWSMGGGGTLIDANTHPELKAVFAMEPWNTDTSYTNDTVPTLIFAGTSDGLAGPPMPQNQYQSIPATTPKILYEINNGSHYVSTSPTNTGTDMAPDSASTANVARFGLSWLKVYLECDTRFRQFLTVKPADAAEFDTTLM
jgi:dienelactone hydrolase